MPSPSSTPRCGSRCCTSRPSRTRWWAGAWRSTPFLGSYLLAEAVDAVGADLVLHGHAHGGSEKGITAGGVPVRNVAQPVIGHSYNLYCLGGDDQLACEP